MSPVERRRHNGDFRRALHDRVVDRNVGLREECFTCELDRAFVVDRAGVTHARRFEHIGANARGDVEQRVGAKTEHAGVPHVIAGSDVAFRGLAIGFLDEGTHFATGSAANGGTHADISEPGFRMRRPDAEGDQPSVRGQRCRAVRVGEERIDVADQMIGRKDHERRVRARMLDRVQRREQHGRRGVAAGGLQQERQLVEIGGRVIGVFVARQEVIIATGNRQHLTTVGDT